MSVIGEVYTLWKEWKDDKIRLLVKVARFMATDGRTGKVVTISNIGKRPTSIMEVFVPFLNSDLRIVLKPDTSLNDKLLPCLVSCGDVFCIHVPCDRIDQKEVSSIGNVTVRISTGQLIEGPRLFDDQGL
ncbi:MAG: hypothetical protein IKH04_10825 [Kiritimatiellae bacterium]|nr:hypothetical protein [Kiritimatiellia bacterium]